MMHTRYSIHPTRHHNRPVCPPRAAPLLIDPVCADAYRSEAAKAAESSASASMVAVSRAVEESSSTPMPTALALAAATASVGTASVAAAATAASAAPVAALVTPAAALVAPAAALATPALEAPSAPLRTAATSAGASTSLASSRPVVVASCSSNLSDAPSGTDNNTSNESNPLREEVQRAATPEVEAKKPATAVIQVGSRRCDGDKPYRRRDDVVSEFSEEDEHEQESVTGKNPWKNVTAADTTTVVDAGGATTTVQAGDSNADVDHGNRRQLSPTAAEEGLTLNSGGAAERGWAFATSALSPMEDEVMAGGPPAVAAAAARRFSFSDEEDEEEEGHADSVYHHHKDKSVTTVPTAMSVVVAPAGRGATERLDDAVASSVPTKTRLQRVSSFSSSGDEDDDALDSEARPRTTASTSAPPAGYHNPAVLRGAATAMEAEEGVSWGGVGRLAGVSAIKASAASSAATAMELTTLADDEPAKDETPPARRASATSCIAAATVFSSSEHHQGSEADRTGVEEATVTAGSSGDEGSGRRSGKPGGYAKGELEVSMVQDFDDDWEDEDHHYDG